jgi:hypothetical protein
MNEKFVWREYLYGRKAETEIGCYFVFDNARQDAFMEAGTSFAAFFQPPQGRARLPKHKQGLGCFETLRAAQERCELKAREGGTEETLKTSPVAILKAKLVQQTRQIAHAEHRDGSLFDLKRDKPEDIARVIVGNVSDHRACEIIKAITDAWKSKRQPAG